MKIYLTIIAFLGFYISSNAQQNSTAKLCISIKSKNVSTYEDLDIQLKITAIDSIKEITFRKCLIWGYNSILDDMDIQDAVFEVEKLIGKIYNDKGIRRKVDDHNVRCFDSSGNELFNILSIKNELVYTKNIVPYYIFNKGMYRVRVKLNIPENEKNKLTSLYSKWVYFKIISKQIE